MCGLSVECVVWRMGCGLSGLNSLGDLGLVYVCVCVFVCGYVCVRACVCVCVLSTT